MKPYYWIILMVALGSLACSAKKKKKNESVFVNNVAINEIVARRAVLSFTTAAPAYAIAELGVIEDQLTREVRNPEVVVGSMATTHVIPLEDLDPETAYFVRVVATTETEEEVISALVSFTTAANTDSLGRENISLLEAGDIDILSVSSNRNGGENDEPYGVNHAFDGLFATEWSTDGDGSAAFVEFQFIVPTEVGGFGFRSRKDSNGTGVITKLKLFFDGIEYAELETPNPDQFYEFDFNVPIEVTEVRVQAVASTGGNTGAREIQFFPPVD